ncbi:MAG: dTDP-glucose 4,6-dehydratase [Myxococcota bacterium]
MRRVLVTGGLGFIGSNFVRALLARDAEVQVVNLDLMTYAGNPMNLADVERSPRYRFVRGDVRDPALVEDLVRDADCVVHFAAETHVDRSTKDPGEFIQTNVYGTYVLLDAVRRAERRIRFLQVGTDEVYGSLPRGFASEEARLQPSSPYSASKAGGDLQALGFHRTFGLDIVISRCTNNYGPFQYPEKVVPLFVTHALDDRPLPLYDGGTQVRDWLWVEDHCAALLLLLREGRSGEIYNIGANQDPEVTNGELTRMILRAAGKPESLIEPVSGLRPGHDQRYAVDTSKLRALGWQPQLDLQTGIERTVEWYAQHRDWWERLKSGEYLEYYRRHYRHDA